MFVQLVGLPGSGKSTLAAALVRLHPDRFVIVDPAYDRLLARLLRHPGEGSALVVRLMPWIASSLAPADPPMPWRDRLAPWSTLIQLLLRRSEVARARPDSAVVHVFDEYIYQRALSLFGEMARVPSEAAARRFLGALAAHEARPIFVDLDPELALRRAQARAEGAPRRVATFSAADLERLYSRQQAVFELLKSIAGRPICVSGNVDPAEAARAIHRRLFEEGRP